MLESLKEIEKQTLARAKKIKSEQDLALLRAEVLGKKGTLGALLRGLGELTPAERPQAGEQINAAKSRIETALEQIQAKLLAKAQSAALEAGRYDVTLPGRRLLSGAPHPLRIVEEDLIRALVGLGFVVAEGPLVEHDWYNFEALNIPADHPARDMQDTFFVGPQVLLRTHTSNVQIRAMLKQKPPIRILAPGMVFRKDDVDLTHSPVFHQIEGLWIDTSATFADLRGVLRHIATQLFGPSAKVRFRPSFFPFTEPSAEVDISCFACGGTGRLDKDNCRLCKASGWLEIGGAGMVHPNVLTAVGYDPEDVQGFAFGCGLERIAMLRWGVDDMRLFYENDLRFLEQFAPGAKAGTRGL